MIILTTTGEVDARRPCAEPIRLLAESDPLRSDGDNENNAGMYAKAYNAYIAPHAV